MGAEVTESPPEERQATVARGLCLFSRLWGLCLFSRLWECMYLNNNPSATGSHVFYCTTAVSFTHKVDHFAVSEQETRVVPSYPLSQAFHHPHERQLPKIRSGDHRWKSHHLNIKWLCSALISLELTVLPYQCRWKHVQCDIEELYSICPPSGCRMFVPALITTTLYRLAYRVWLDHFNSHS